MTVVPILPKNAPFSAEDLDLLNRVVPRTTPTQRSWLAGFLAGYDAALGGTPAQPTAVSRPKVPLTILYATESGNTEALAGKARKAAQKLGFDAKVADMGDSELSILTKAKTLVVYASTWGEGDPPQRAVDFIAKLMSDDAPRLDGVQFAVCSLGDTAYVNFCAIGKAIDARLEALGGTRAADRVDLDLEYAKQAAAWTEAALAKLAPPEDAASGTVVHVDFKSAGLPEDDDEPRYTSETPLEAEISELINLNGTGSTRETWHAEFTTDAPGFAYKPGDAIGILPENDPEVVAALIDAVGLGGNSDLQTTLTQSKDVTTLSRPIIEAYGKLTRRDDVLALSTPEKFAEFAADRQLVDLFELFPEKLSPEQLTTLLRALPGRLYSVASSLAAHPGEAHLLVGAVRWTSHGKVRKGVTSTYLAERRKSGDTARIYVKPNRHFALPSEGQRPIIMIGAGTGIAPYRGFVEERAEAGAKGQSWLFFGERNYSFDFLYQLEWQDYLASGALSRIDVAFSRDQPEKIYVQHRLWERREELRRWLADGAHLYVCGDEKGMAKDVDTMLARIIAEPLGGDEEKGRAALADLRRENRYQRDVY